MKIKKVLSAVVSAAICCSFLPANISAEEFEMPIATDSYVSLTGETVNENNFNMIAASDYYQLGNIEITPAQLNGISTYSNSGISTYSNANFVMDLQLSASNPESLINGSPTTNTVLYWFWSYGDEDYTYDPNGNEIVQHYVIGIDDYLLGTLSMNDKVIGFATQFTEAGPQEFQYYAENSNGDICGTSCSITIEPADGNNRPTASLQAAGQYYDNTNIIFDWSNSYDTDNGDYIVDGRIRVYSENGDYEVATEESSQYYVSKGSTSATLKFPTTGNYTVAVSVSDNHNNWSNWVGGKITISENPIQIITLADTEWKDSKSVRTKPTGSNSYVNHTLWSRLGGDICVLKGTGGTYSTYTNHNGTYYNVAYDIIAPGTVFMSAETWVSSSNPNNYNDPVFGEETPRAITQEDIDYFVARGKPIYIVYDPATLKVIDFYSDLNPLIRYKWSVVTAR